MPSVVKYLEALLLWGLGIVCVAIVIVTNPITSFIYHVLQLKSHKRENRAADAVKKAENQWEHIRNQNSLVISVIIPVLNESANIGSTLDSVYASRTRYTEAERNISPELEIEVIVIDGGSIDNTVEIVQDFSNQFNKTKSQPPFTITLLRSPKPGRGYQQMYGADHAKGDIYFFLHGDCILQPGYDVAIFRALVEALQTAANDKPILGGAFSFDLDVHDDPSLWPVIYGANLRSRYFGLPYGDQGYFFWSSIFQQLGGFPNQAFMEDYELMLQIKKIGGKIQVINMTLVTQSRRYLRNGALKNTFKNQFYVVMHTIFKVNPQKIHEWYYART